MNRIVKSALIAGLSALTLGIGTARADVIHETAPIAQPIPGNPQRLPAQSGYQQGNQAPRQDGRGQAQGGYGQPQGGYGQPQRTPQQPQQHGAYNEPQRTPYQPQNGGYRGPDQRDQRDQDGGYRGEQYPQYEPQRASWNDGQAWDRPVTVSWTRDSYFRAQRELDRQRELFFAGHGDFARRQRYEQRMAERRAELRRQYEEQCRLHGERPYFGGWRG